MNCLNNFRMRLLFVCICWTTVINVTYQEEVLMLLPLSSQSHKNVFFPIAEALVKKGHRVTIMSPLTPKTVNPSITEISLTELKPYFNEVRKLATNVKDTGLSIGLFQKYMELVEDMSKLMYETGHLQKWIKTKPFKLVLVDGVMSDSVIPVAELIGGTMVVINTANLFSWVAWAFDCPYPYSYLPEQMTNYTTQMTFFERVHNSMSYTFFNLIQSLYIVPRLSSFVRSYFPEARPLFEAMSNASFVLINADPFTPKPYMPNMAEIGGIHCVPANPLPKDLENFVESSGEDGFIIFSLGSIHDSKLMELEKIESLKSAFSRLKQKVIWKHEGELSGIPSNVKVVKWLPQQDLLGHPKARLFITHSGLLSLQEAIYHGVPMVGIPLFADQPNNVAVAQEKGLMIALNWNTFTEDELYTAADTVLKNPSYKENVRKWSAVFKDRLHKPQDTAVFWLEYLMRHNGATHLKSQAGALNIFQYFLIDVVGFLAAIVLISISIPYFVFKKLFRCPRKPNHKKKLN